MAMGTHWNPPKEVIWEILAQIESIRSDLQELKELRQITSPKPQIQWDSYEEGRAQLDSYEQEGHPRSIENADMVFERMPSKEIVPSSSKIPKFRSTMIDKETTSFTLGGSIDGQVEASYSNPEEQRKVAESGVYESINLEDDEFFNQDEESNLIEMENGPNVRKELTGSDARKVFDEVPKQENWAIMNFEVQPKSGASLGRQEWNREFPAMPPEEENRKSDQKNSSWRSDFKGGTNCLPKLDFPIIVDMQESWQQMRVSLVRTWEEIEKWPQESQTSTSVKVTSNLLETPSFKVESKRVVGISIIFLQNEVTSKVPDKMPSRRIETDLNFDGIQTHELGNLNKGVNKESDMWRQRQLVQNFAQFCKDSYMDRCVRFIGNQVYDPGGVFGMLITGFALDFRDYAATVEAGILELRLQWDPGENWLLLSFIEGMLVQINGSSCATVLIDCCWVLGGLISWLMGQSNRVYDPGGIKSLNFQVLNDSLRNVKFNLQPLVNVLVETH